MNRGRMLASLFFSGLIFLAMYAGEPLFAVILSIPFAFSINRSLVHGIFQLPTFFKWARFRKWQGQFVSFNDVHIRVERARKPGVHPILVVEDVERALNLKLGRFSREIVPRDGMLSGLRCVRSDILYTAIKPYAAGGASEKRLVANQFNRWLKATLISPIELERERSQRAAKQRIPD